MPRPSAPLAAAAVLLLCSAALSACGGESPERRAAREAAHRDACIAEELAINARTRFANLDEMQRNSAAEGSPLAAAMSAPHTFARALNDHSESRRMLLAFADSAAHAASPADSTRFVESARRFAVARGEPGSLEANVAQRWNEDFAQARQNPDHPCNQAPEKR